MKLKNRTKEPPIYEGDDDRYCSGRLSSSEAGKATDTTDIRRMVFLRSTKVRRNSEKTNSSTDCSIYNSGRFLCSIYVYVMFFFIKQWPGTMEKHKELCSRM
jgi:hypothetical protein